MKKNLLEEYENDFYIYRINSHHGHRAIILSKKKLGTKSGISRSTKVSQAQFGGKLRRK